MLENMVTRDGNPTVYNTSPDAPRRLISGPPKATQRAKRCGGPSGSPSSDPIQCLHVAADRRARDRASFPVAVHQHRCAVSPLTSLTVAAPCLCRQTLPGQVLRLILRLDSLYLRAQRVGARAYAFTCCRSCCRSTLCHSGNCSLKLRNIR